VFILFAVSLTICRTQLQQPSLSPHWGYNCWLAHRQPTNIAPVGAQWRLL